ncbi:MAG TPA: hypothetical protein VF791_13495 [Pyrinomonadaceae bacterium]
MRAVAPILLLALAMCGCAKLKASAPAVPVESAHEPTVSSPAKVDFKTQIRPILEARCMPCHFAGGTMYERLPFDRPETIKKLGTKLFTRLKDEKEQRLIQEFLSQE